MATDVDDWAVGLDDFYWDLELVGESPDFQLAAPRRRLGDFLTIVFEGVFGERFSRVRVAEKWHESARQNGAKKYTSPTDRAWSYDDEKLDYRENPV